MMCFRSESRKCNAIHVTLRRESPPGRHPNALANTACTINCAGWVLIAVEYEASALPPTARVPGPSARVFVKSRSGEVIAIRGRHFKDEEHRERP